MIIHYLFHLHFHLYFFYLEKWSLEPTPWSPSLQSKTGKSPVYAAYLAQPSKMSFSQDSRRRGVAHADDIMYLNGHFLTQADKYPAEAAVAESLQQYWVNFAKTLNPNGKGLPYWPTFNDTKPTTMQFSNGASLITVPNREQIDFVDRYYRAKRDETENARKWPSDLLDSFSFKKALIIWYFQRFFLSLPRETQIMEFDSTPVCTEE